MARNADEHWAIRPHTDHRVTVFFPDDFQTVWGPMIEWVRSKDAPGWYDWDWIEYPREAEFGFSNRNTAFEFKLRWGGLNAP